MTVDHASAVETQGSLSRRDRKKRETRRTIRRVALDLALETGVESLTVEEIAEASDVSTRTFFNYFSCKENALVGDATLVSADLRELIKNRPDHESPFVMLREVLLESAMIGLDSADRDEVYARQRLVHENPALLPRQLAYYAAIEKMLAEGIAERFEVNTNIDMRPALLATIIASAMRVAIQRWVVDESQSLNQWVESVFDQIERHELVTNSW